MPEGQTVNTDVTPVVGVIDSHLGPVTITLDGAPFVSGRAVTAEGSHTLRIEAADTCGNHSERTLTFTIDKTPPAIAITGVVDGACGNGDVTPVVTATDAHLTGVEVTLNGVPFARGTAVTAEGEYTLVAVAIDAAGNTGRQERRFTIDKTAPAIAIQGVADGAIVNTPVTPVIAATDSHPGTLAATLNGQPFASGTAVTAEGDYTLVVTATDGCGNSSSRTVRFTIDKTPPTITITGGLPAGCVNVDVTPVFTATDLHLDTVIALLNGQLFTSGTAVTAAGDYTLQVSARDTAGNTATAVRTWALDKTPPAITITGVAEGQVTTGSLTPAFAVTDAHPGSVTATLNGAPFTSGTAVSAAGAYTLTVTAADTCGNSSQRTVRFTINTAATCQLYPIALHSSTVQGAQVGATLPDVFNGSGSGNFGWLTWTGANSVPSLITSLTPPGDSQTYVNPNNVNDHTVSVGDWVQGRPGVANASGVRSALDDLETRDIVVPLWDVATGQGSGSRYHIVGFVRIRILDYRLPSQNRITARFLGMVNCGG